MSDHQARHVMGAQERFDLAGSSDEAATFRAPGFRGGEERVRTVAYGRVRAQVLEEKGPRSPGVVG